MTERERRVLQRTGRLKRPTVSVPPIGTSLGNTSHLHRHKTHWERYENLPTKWRILATLWAWFRV